MDRLKKLKLLTPKYHRARGDMIYVFKILHRYYENINNISFYPHLGVDIMDVPDIRQCRIIQQDLRSDIWQNRVYDKQKSS